MEKHKIDSLVKKTLNESKDFYDSEAINAKDRIWENIHHQKQEKPLFNRWLAAASILLFIGLSVVTFSNMKYQATINTLVESNSLLKIDLYKRIQNLPTKNETIATSIRHITDTIYIEKEIIQYKPIVTTKHITDTVFVNQIVYVEKEKNVIIATENENLASLESSSKTVENYYQSDIIISSNDAIEKKKLKKIKIQFGGNRSRNNKGTLALSTKPLN